MVLPAPGEVRDAVAKPGGTCRFGGVDGPCGTGLLPGQLPMLRGLKLAQKGGSDVSTVAVLGACIGCQVSADVDLETSSRSMLTLGD
jgi:hypothetical protein